MHLRFEHTKACESDNLIKTKNEFCKIKNCITKIRFEVT